MITFNSVNNQIVGSVNGEDFSVKYTEKLWDEMVALNAELQEKDTLKEAQKVCEKFAELVKDDPKEEIESITPFMTYNPNTRTYHLKQDDKVSKVPMPQNLVDKILYAKDNGLSVDPLIKFYTRALRAPRVYKAARLEDATTFLERAFGYIFQTFVSPSLYKKYFEDEGFSEEVAREKATVPQTPITMEGLLCTKKVVDVKYDQQRYKFELDDDGNPQMVLRDSEGVGKEIDEDSGEVTVNDPDFAEDWVFWPAMMKNGEEFYCGEEDDAPLGNLIRIGKEARLKGWDSVNCDDHRSCVKGLHTGNQTYINGWETPETVTLNCFVDPANIGAIPIHQSGPDAGVIRVKNYFPHSIKNRQVDNRNLYHSSHYAALGDKRWAELRKEAIEALNEKLEAYKKEIENSKEMIPA